MDEKIRTQEEVAMSTSPTKQEQKEKNQNLLDQKERQEASEKEEGVERRG